MLFYALHKIQQAGRNSDGTLATKNGKTVIETVEPGTIFAPYEADIDSLLALGAVREPNKTEMALHQMANPEPKPSNLGDWDGDGNAGGAKPVEPAESNDHGLTAKHKGGGRYVVLDAAGEVVSGDTVLDKTSAAQWIADFVPASPGEEVAEDETTEEDDVV